MGTRDINQKGFAHKGKRQKRRNLNNTPRKNNTYEPAKSRREKEIEKNNNMPELPEQAGDSKEEDKVSQTNMNREDMTLEANMMRQVDMILEANAVKKDDRDSKADMIAKVDAAMETDVTGVIDVIEEIGEKESKEIKTRSGKKPKRSIKKIFFRSFLSFFTLVFLVFLTLLGTVLIMNYGPSVTARNLFVNSVMESSAGKFMATLFFTEEEIIEIRNQNSVEKTDEITDPGLIEIPKPSQGAEADVKPIEVIDITGGTYKGKLMLVRDPSRVTVGISGEYGPSNVGKTVKQMAISYNAVAAVNGGGFEDINGMGNGGTPIGIVISDGKIKYGSPAGVYEIIGFDKDHKLVVGSMSGQEALNRGVRDALSFGPILIVNGEASIVHGAGSGLNPRTAIGQRADGTILLLTVDGRQANSLGAAYGDLINIMLEYGAVNAANLDGGSSTLMYYEGEYINNHSSLYGAREMPTSIIVR